MVRPYSMNRIGPNRLKVLLMYMEARQRSEPPPSLCELARRLGLASPWGVWARHVMPLHREGLICVKPRSCRSVETLCRFIPADQL